MSDERGGQVHQYVESLKLTGPRDRQQAFDCAFTLLAPCAEHSLSPLNRRSECPLSGIVGGLDAIFAHEREEKLVMHKERARQIADVVVDGI